ncbi:MAG: hypothetical protein ABIS50_10605 [Luteolibacter sp.]|uniref:hypothetical protein n=1 Tax=Luteolibacter sp. TaxID=1962973 RepID=UPI0032630BD7
MLSCVSFSTTHAEEAPQVEVNCGVVYSLLSRPIYSLWATNVPSVMGGSEWDQILHLVYAPFVVVKNNTGWPLKLDTGGTGVQPKVTFDQPKLGLEFKRVGDSHPGFITTSAVDLNKMYVNGGTSKTFYMNLYGAGSPPSGYKSLAPGESCIFTPYIPVGTTVDSVLDWQNSLTSALLVSPGWKGPSNGYCSDYLTGQAALTPGVNGNLRIVPTRSQDGWDVRVSTIGPLNGCRVFRHAPPVSANWPSDLGASNEITQFPFSLSDNQAPILTSDMDISSVQSIGTWIVPPVFSVLLPPKTRTGFVTDRNRNSMNDEWEKFYFDGITPNASQDQDKDGYSNLFEYLAGTSPVDSSDFIRQSLVETESDGLRIEWSSVANRTYVVETSGNLTDWTPSAPITAASATTSQPVTRPATGPLFVRIRIVPPTQSS